jgi:hypothetical protein
MTKKTPYFISIAIIFCSSVMASTNNVLLGEARAKISECRRILSNNPRYTDEYILEFGFPASVDSSMRDLGYWASTNSDFVCQNFNLISTNDIDRMLVLYSESIIDEPSYMTFLNKNVDLTLAGTISTNELYYFQFWRKIPARGHLIALQYDQPGVSNIVYKLMTCTGQTNYYSSVLSGAMKKEIEEWILDNQPFSNQTNTTYTSSEVSP